MSAKIFISYRREDSGGYTSTLEGWLTSQFGAGTIFLDVHSIGRGEDFMREIEQAIAKSEVFLAIIGENWTKICAKNGRVRLRESKDPVRREVELALARGLEIIPVLVGHERMPRENEVPASLHPLLRLNACPIRRAHFRADVKLLIDALAKHFPGSASAAEKTSGLDPSVFAWRGGIIDPAAFHGRRAEMHMLGDFMRNGTSCQVVGPRRIGKSSLLRQVELNSSVSETRTSYLDLRDPRCQTLAGWFQQVSRGLQLPGVARDLQEWSGQIDSLRLAGWHPVLCLDEFGELTKRRAEFPSEFFDLLQSADARGMTIITAADRPLNELLDPGLPSAVFFHERPLVQLNLFNVEQARSYVTRERAGLPAFSSGETNAILRSAGGHPLRLQNLCYHVLLARAYNEYGLNTAVRRAEAELPMLAPAPAANFNSGDEDEPTLKAPPLPAPVVAATVSAIGKATLLYERFCADDVRAISNCPTAQLAFLEKLDPRVHRLFKHIIRKAAQYQIAHEKEHRSEVLQEVLGNLDEVRMLLSVCTGPEPGIAGDVCTNWREVFLAERARLR